jgi:valyl-tRNA synthetase
VIDGIALEALQEKLKLGNLDEKEYDIASKNQKESFPHGIPECGTDALRFSLVNYTTGGGDINFDIKQMAGYRRFCKAPCRDFPC